MPEGDTIHKLARALAPLVSGRTFTVGPRRLAPEGDQPVLVLGAHARGKHLLIELEGGLELRTHLGMYGSWHRYEPGEAWRKPAGRACLTLEGRTDVLVCFDAKEVQVLRRGSVPARRLDARIGLDLLSATESQLTGLAAEIIEGRSPETSLADLLLDQSAASGIGNVYKSEVLFVRGLLPDRSLGTMSEPSLGELYRCAAFLLRANLGTARRRTRFGGPAGERLWVYRRTGLPCLRCAEPVVRARLGRHHRSTYWCPRCQG